MAWSKWGDHHRSWIQELCRTFILQSSDHVHQEIDKEVLGGLAYTETFIHVQCTVCVCMFIESVHVSTVHECLYAEVNTWLIIIILSSLMVSLSTRLVGLVIHLQ